jgi:hypothetical protein
MSQTSLPSPRVFISHSSKNKPHAQRLASALLLNGIRVWLDDWEILVGHNIYDSVYGGILSSDYLAIVLTRDALDSRWVNEELSFARQRELEERNVIVLPLVFEQIELPLHLRMRKYADFTHWDRGFGELMRIFRKNPSVNKMDQSILDKVRDTIHQRGGDEVVSTTRKVTSQAANRIISESSLTSAAAEVMLKAHAADNWQMGAEIFLEIGADKVKISLLVDLKAKSSQTLALIIRMLVLEEVVDSQSISYFLLYDGRPVGTDESLEEVGVTEGSTIQIGAYSFAIE